MGVGHADARVCRRIGALKAKRDLLRRLDNSVARLIQYDDSIKTPDESCPLREVAYSREQMKEVRANAEPLSRKSGSYDWLYVYDERHGGL
jgi:hypothetical protein